MPGQSQQKFFTLWVVPTSSFLSMRYRENERTRTNLCVPSRRRAIWNIFFRCLPTCALLCLSACNERSKGDLKDQEAFIRQGGFLSLSSQDAMKVYMDAVLSLQNLNITKDQLRAYREGRSVVPPTTLSTLTQVADMVRMGAKQNKVDLPEQAQGTKNAILEAPYPRTRIQIGPNSIEISSLILCPEACLVVADSLFEKSPEESLRILKAVLAMGLQLTATKDDICVAVGIFCKEKALLAIRAIAVSQNNTGLIAQCDAMISSVRLEFEAIRANDR